ncbi:MAG: hypothetical protein Q9169_002473 [Polycauliona sp. 2 TL-2023]
MRNTDRSHLWNSQLRHSHVSFISAGNSVPDEMLKPKDSPLATPRGTAHSSLPQASLANMTIEDPVQEGSDVSVNVQKLREGGPEIRSKHTPEPDVLQPNQNLFFMDGTGSRVMSESKLNPPKLPRSLSPTPSNSGDEVVVFTGRKAVQRSTPQQKQPEPTVQSQGNIAKQKNEHQAHTDKRSTGQSSVPAKERLKQPSHGSGAPVPSLGSPIVQPQEDEFTIPVMQSGRMRQKRQPRARQSRSQAVEDELLADYIENMDDADVVAGSAHGFGLNESLAANIQTTPMSQSAIDTDAAEEAINSLLDRSHTWDSNDMGDFDDLSTSTEDYSGLDKVLASRQRPAGQQYLVVGQNQSIDDARWIPLSSLNSANALERIRDFEFTREEFQIGDFSSEDSDDSIDDEQLSADLREDLESMEDERDLVEGRQARMTDERIARLLSKQEELGLGSSELLLFDGADEDDEDEEDPPPTAYIPLKKGRGKKARQPPGDFASASLFAEELGSDPYGDFDVMDHDRLSLRKKPKGRRGVPTFDLSDSELEASIQLAHEKDRSKKKIRKKEREELRLQGLLGKTGHPNLDVKYKEGITLHQAREEIIDFMTSDKQRYIFLLHTLLLVRLTDCSSLALPSMAHKDRKLIHEMANKLKLKSKSNGEGKSRYPMLYKTARTEKFNQNTMSQIMQLLNSKRFLPRMNNKGTGKAAAIKRTRGGNAAGKTAGVSYQDGEVVGAAAPEIGLENRGRAMLEKMGWSKGTALGALNNKGMLQPVTHIVKTTKAGLG